MLTMIIIILSFIKWFLAVSHCSVYQDHPHVEFFKCVTGSASVKIFFARVLSDKRKGWESCWCKTFSENQVAFFYNFMLQKSCLKVQNMYNKFFD